MLHVPHACAYAGVRDSRTMTDIDAETARYSRPARPVRELHSAFQPLVSRWTDGGITAIRVISRVTRISRLLVQINGVPRAKRYENGWKVKRGRGGGEEEDRSRPADGRGRPKLLGGSRNGVRGQGRVFFTV